MDTAGTSIPPFSWDAPYPSHRAPVLAANVVATSQPLASQVGLRMLLGGGNAVDAALAAAIALTVVEPCSNGLGSDAFALVWDGAHLHGYNGSGRSPKAWTAQRFAGLPEMPRFGWDAITVPGAVDLWARLSERFGRLPFEALFAPAIDYARHGYPVSPMVAQAWSFAPRLYKDFPDFAECFLHGGRAPKAGETFRSEAMATSLTDIATTMGESFYRGPLAEAIAHCAHSAGGAMTLDDLGGHHGQWVAPISVNYRDRRLHENPPNGQGLAALIALGILQRFDLAAHPADSADSVHLQLEAMKIAFAEAHRHVADPAHMELAPDDLLSNDILDRRAAEIRLDRAGRPEPLQPAGGGTVYLTAADASGMMVSLIQSNFQGFGSGVVVPGTGIALQNRGRGFSVVPGHPNVVAGGKRPFHTIIPGFVTGGSGEPLMSFGVMGGHMQPQGHVQMMTRIFDYGQNPQSAADAPRWYVAEDFSIALESGFPPEVAAELRRRGHAFMTPPTPWIFGGAQLIYRLPSGMYCGASEPRKDGQAVGY